MKTKKRKASIRVARLVWLKRLSKKKRAAILEQAHVMFDCEDTKDALYIKHESGASKHLWFYMVVGAWSKIENWK